MWGTYTSEVLLGRIYLGWVGIFGEGILGGLFG